MRCRFTVLLLFMAFAPLPAFADFPFVRPKIDPAGIDGTLILHGSDAISQSALEQFVKKAAGKEKSTIVIAAARSTKFVDVVRLQSALQKEITSQKRKNLRLVINTGTAIPLDSATGLWFTNDNEPDAFAANELREALRKPCQSVLMNGGVVAGPASRFGAFFFNKAKAIPALHLLPNSVFDTSASSPKSNQLEAAWKKRPSLIGFHLEPKSAIIVSGRRIVAVGEGDVTIHLPEAKGRPAFRKKLSGRRRVADLTALRYAAWERAQPPFPPEKPQPPTVEKGTLMLVGGASVPKGLLKRFVKSAGGKDASIVIFPTAMPDPVPKLTGLQRIFRNAGAKKVTVLPQRKLADVESAQFLKVLKEATGLWFDGGRQWRYVDAYYGTKAHEVMFDVLKRDGVIGGSSAGASIQAEYLARGDPTGNVNIIAPGYERGLAFLKGVAVDQHFSQRLRYRDMSSLVETYSQLLGIGIDESTAIIVQGNVAEVVGLGQVFFYDAKRKREKHEPDYQAVSDGGRYDLKSRKVIDPGKTKNTFKLRLQSPRVQTKINTWAIEPINEKSTGENARWKKMIW